MAEAGAVAWQFEQKGVITVDVDEDQGEEFTLISIDLGADDIDTFDSTLQIYSPPGSMEAIRATLEQNDAHIRSSELSRVPSHTISLDGKQSLQTLRLLDRLEELDDVQRIYSNADFSDEALESYRVE